MLIRRENTGDVEAIADVHTAAFEGDQPIEVGLVDALRVSAAWLPALSLVALDGDRIVGHVVCTRAHVAGRPALGLGPLGVLPDTQRGGVGTALMHAVLGVDGGVDVSNASFRSLSVPNASFRASELGRGRVASRLTWRHAHRSWAHPDLLHELPARGTSRTRGPGAVADPRSAPAACGSGRP